MKRSASAQSMASSDTGGPPLDRATPTAGLRQRGQLVSLLFAPCWRLECYHCLNFQIVPSHATYFVYQKLLTKT